MFLRNNTQLPAQVDLLVPVAQAAKKSNIKERYYDYQHIKTFTNVMVLLVMKGVSQLIIRVMHIMESLSGRRREIYRYIPLDWRTSAS